MIYDRFFAKKCEKAVMLDVQTMFKPIENKKGFELLQTLVFSM